MATKTAAKPQKEKQNPAPKNQSLDTPAFQRKAKNPDAPAPASQAASVADAPSATMEAPAPQGVALRMPAINEVKVVGRLTRDPETKMVGKQNVLNFSVAVEKKYVDGQGEWQKQVSFVPVALWGVVADRAKSFLHQGSPVYLEGRLRSSSWQTKDGQNRSMLRLEAYKVQSLAKNQNRSQSQGQEIGD